MALSYSCQNGGEHIERGKATQREECIVKGGVVCSRRRSYDIHSHTLLDSLTYIYSWSWLQCFGDYIYIYFFCFCGTLVYIYIYMLTLSFFFFGDLYPCCFCKLLGLFSCFCRLLWFVPCLCSLYALFYLLCSLVLLVKCFAFSLSTFTLVP